MGIRCEKVAPDVMGQGGSTLRGQALLPISGEDREAVIRAFTSQPADPLPLKDLERDLRAHLVNFVIIVPSSKQSEAVWYKPRFSVYMLYTSTPTGDPWLPKVIAHRNYEFVVLCVDRVSAVHITFFLNKSKIYIRRSEFLRRLIALSLGESIEISIVGAQQAPITTLPPMVYVDPTTNPLLSQSESMMQSSSYAAFQDYRRAQSHASRSTAPESEVGLSNVPDSEATMDSVVVADGFPEYSYPYSSASMTQESGAGRKPAMRSRGSSRSASATSYFVDE
jgi:hypothetical protein